MCNDDFAESIIRWQKTSGRHDLPWQGGGAYHVWLSEIMLQQTQVTTVIPYFKRFLERFPDLAGLAAAPTESVLELWSGLGYYARARNLHRCARLMVEEWGGVFPADPGTLSGLPGIGRSTAAAICVFAFGVRAAILDANVKRVLSRCFGIDSPSDSAETVRQLWSLAESLLPHREIRTYTQGVMDLGATVCVGRKPLCPVCPLSRTCRALREGLQDSLPRPRTKKKKPCRETSLLLITDGGRVFLERRPASGIWGGLLSLPECDAEHIPILARHYGCRIETLSPLPAFRHQFSHFELAIQPWLCRVERTPVVAGEPGTVWLESAAVGGAALPAPIRALLARVFADL